MELSWRSAKKDSEREHVTPYMYNNQNEFKIFHYINPQNYSSFRYTVDEMNDLILARNIVSKIQKRPILMSDVVDLLTKEDKLNTINKNVKHRHIS